MAGAAGTLSQHNSSFSGSHSLTHPSSRANRLIYASTKSTDELKRSTLKEQHGDDSIIHPALAQRSPVPS
ncbi:hypothetical protein EYF80_003259 [Liparis tanakae]|uniref:Uncharacterized protein n=1 Tax=Liparis tanakae TaxID=230148 RepID=A0A4Z2J8J0_9TELE|nr:hypothetical protein EYF80_003259 [Liparis tanakae]